MRSIPAASAVRALAAASVLVLMILTLLWWAVPNARADEDAAAADITWSIEPADADGPDGRVSIRQELDPGSDAADHVTVTNFSSTPATFHVYASDGLVGDDGAFDLLPPGETPVDSGSWIEFDAPAGAAESTDGGIVVTLDAGAAVTVPVAIAVPPTAIPGDHPAGIVAEFIPDDQDDIQLASRVGVRLHIRVNGKIQASLAVSDVSASWTPNANPFAPGTVVVRFTTANTGNVRLAGSSNVVITGPFGLLPVKGGVEHREILPGGTVVDTVELTAWPLVLSSATVRLTPTAVGDDAVEGAIAAADADVSVWTIPWSQAALLLLLCAAILLLRRARVRAKARVQQQIDAAVAEARAAER